MDGLLISPNLKKVFIHYTKCSPTCKKAGVYAVMSMLLVCIKEHVWSVRTCTTTILLSAMSECANECYIERLKERGIVSYEMADLYTPQS